MRGENLASSFILLALLETSPHAWRKPAGSYGDANHWGNISTCVEKTVSVKETDRLYQKHLHMRGENLLQGRTRALTTETSPHAWRKLAVSHFLDFSCGNISTCVEKTSILQRHKAFAWKHLHMRGENGMLS